MMSNRAQVCYGKYQKNVALAERLEERLPDDRDWNCVVRFYAALHLVTAYLIDRSHVRFDPGSAEHAGRKKAMDRCPELRDAPRRYRQLKDISESVRYDAGFRYTDENGKEVKMHLERIVAIVEPKLNKH